MAEYTASSLFPKIQNALSVNRLWLKVLVIVSGAIFSPYIRMGIFITLPYTLSLRFNQVEFVREGEMFTNSDVISCNVKTDGKWDLTVGLFISFIV